MMVRTAATARPGRSRSGVDAAADGVLREHGQREVFCGLTGIVWLHRKIQDAFFLVVGSRTCAHLMQSAAGVMIFAEPRFGTAIIDERDLAAWPTRTRNSTGSSPGCWSAGRTSACCSSSGPCPSEVIKLDLSRGAALSARFMPGVRVLNYSGSGIETTFTQGEDACLAALVPELPAARRRRAALAAGRRALADVVEDQFRGCCAASASAVRFLPRAPVAPMPVGRPVHAHPAGAAVPRRHRPRARGAAARLICRPFPFGAEGTTAWLGRRGRVRPRRRASSPPSRRPARAPSSAALAPAAALLAGKASSSSPIRSWRCRWRFAARELGMTLVEVGTPYLHRHLADELACCRRARG